jgi:Fur family zinc uptake transcriptional regulator
MSAHDHTACMATTLAAATSLGPKFTPLRRRVLAIVLESHTPLGAYDVLAALAKDGTRPAPPTVYRALNFLKVQGLVHRIDSRNAFVACFAPGKAHRNHFLLCDRCGRAVELAEAPLDTALEDAAKARGFVVERETVEITGKCADCASLKPLKA